MYNSHHGVHKGTPLSHVQSQMNPVHKIPIFLYTYVYRPTLYSLVVILYIPKFQLQSLRVLPPPPKVWKWDGHGWD
jgi:hypothetical protein